MTTTPSGSYGPAIRSAAAGCSRRCAPWTDPAEDQARMAAARRSAAALAPYASGVYVNALSDEGAEGVRRAYPAGKLARLTAVKDSYDPCNVFHLNQNIRPSHS